MINDLIKKIIDKQFFRFCLIGVFNTSLIFYIYFLLTRKLHLYYLLANTICFFIGVTVSFFLNKKWTFRNKERQTHRQYLKFWLMALCGLGLNAIIIFLLVDYAHLYDFFAMVIATGIILFWNFFMGKHWVFKISQGNISEEAILDKNLLSSERRPRA